MPANYVLLEKITVGAAGSTGAIFSSIPQTGYTDLVVKISVADATGNQTLFMQVNGDTGSNYSERILNAYASSNVQSTASSSRANIYTYSIGDIPTIGANIFGNTEIYIPNYTSSNYKSISYDTAVVSNTAALNDSSMIANIWSSSAAITSLKFYTQGIGLAANSTFYLYGVAKLGTTPVIVPYATGGDTIMTDGTYWYHTFVSSGTFTPAKALSCDYLVVAGGGSGNASGLGTGGAGAGGAGGLRSTVGATGGGGSLESALSLASGTGYTVTIGAGAAAPTYAANTRVSGSNTTFNTITSTGGGGGAGGSVNLAGATGGSGGGGSGNFQTVGGAGTANQGYTGGSGVGVNGGGGGGGAGAVGANGTGTAPASGGNGGVGISTSISGSATYYAGGGGGGNYSGGSAGTGGNGGGGGGGNPGTAGTANTGSGGGGAVGNTATTGGNGGSGIVIVRYAV